MLAEQGASLRECCCPTPMYDAALPGAHDPNLSCSICLNVFSHPVRTACGHVFCQACLQSWLPQKAECPECRAPVTEATRDRFAERLVSNVEGFCQFRSHGCRWVGRRGEMSAHLASDCPAVTICCPNQGCGREVPRSGLPEHMRECAVICRPADGAAEEVECPWGCGLCDSPLQMELHKAECLMEPRKLLAAIHKLHAENTRLGAENEQLRDHVASPNGPRKRAALGGGDDMVFG